MEEHAHPSDASFWLVYFHSFCRLLNCWFHSDVLFLQVAVAPPLFVVTPERSVAEKAFKCSYPGCKSSFSASQNLRKHENKKHGRQPMYRRKAALPLKRWCYNWWRWYQLTSEFGVLGTSKSQCLTVRASCWSFIPVIWASVDQTLWMYIDSLVILHLLRDLKGRIQ